MPNAMLSCWRMALGHHWLCVLAPPLWVLYSMMALYWAPIHVPPRDRLSPTRTARRYIACRSTSCSCCGAGTAADTEQMTLVTSAELDLQELNTNRQVPVICASMLLRRTLFRYQGHISAALVMGGVDKYGPHINCIHPCGSIDKIPYAAMGSGTLAAMSVLEHGWQPTLDLEQGKQLVREAITAGVLNDLGSGSNIDLCVITRNGADHLRTETVASERGERLAKYAILPNTTLVKSISVQDIHIVEERIYRPSISSFHTTSQQSRLDSSMDSDEHSPDT
ncbi:proteasome subunit beta type-7 isoform X3 [Drosophila grimshawi]|uniref:proteasome subunit beta type-7 isoform X3 n=1 Tax=Drosophila grimshawi TaxID=7222 RepID=UPI0013EF4C15|nr:proteasome subunit beta type-7 isoform X3 [Drosophila grimshawi]